MLSLKMYYKKKDLKKIWFIIKEKVMKNINS